MTLYLLGKGFFFKSCISTYFQLFLHKLQVLELRIKIPVFFRFVITFSMPTNSGIFRLRYLFLKVQAYVTDINLEKDISRFRKRKGDENKQLFKQGTRLLSVGT